LLTLKVLVEARESGSLPSQIAAHVGTIRSNTTRDLANLRMAGLATTAQSRWYASSLAKLCVR
jgi:hypothetical protein